MRQLLLSALFAATLPLATLAQDAAAPDIGTPGVATSGTDIANGQSFGDWLVRCDALGVNRTRCMLSQRVARSDNNALLGEVLAFWSDDTPAVPILVVQAPTGLHLPTAFALQPEGAEGDDQRLDFIWQSCNGTLCEAIGLPDQDKLDQLTGAERLLAGYRQTATAEATVFPISTKGLADGLAALKPAVGED